MRPAFDEVLYVGAKALAWAAFQSLFRLRTRGVDGAPRRGPLLVASNHVSGLDPIIIGLGLRQRVFFLARETLLRGFWGYLMKAMGARPIRRDSADRAAIGLALEMLAEGKTVVMFPEGTRSADGTLQGIRSGVGLMAARAGCPVLPVYIRGAGELLPRGKRFPRPGKIAFLVGEAIVPDTVPRNDDVRSHYDAIAKRVHEALSGLEASSGKRTSTPS